MKDIRSVKKLSGLVFSAGVVVCLKQGADLHMAQLMPLPLTVSCSTQVVRDKGPLNGCVCVCSGQTVVVNVTLEREDEIAGPILAPFFPQVSQLHSSCLQKTVKLLLEISKQVRSQIS